VQALRDPKPGRFGRMFAESDEQPSDDAIDALVGVMRRHPASPSNSRIPAGFTYLGQFIDHDITFDPTPEADRRSDRRALENFRTPRFDLDSVYGAGPVAQPYLYDWEGPGAPGTRLLVGPGGSGPHMPQPALVDLPRNQQGRALIGDPRNDENAIVSQLHLLFIRFHNAVVEHLEAVGAMEEPELLGEAQRIVRWHYQWIVVGEFLPLVVGGETARRVYEPAGPDGAPSVRREHFAFHRRAFIPVEFSGAAYRFGHSMVREHYGLRRLPAGGGGPRGRSILPELTGSRPLSGDLVIDWERFFRLPGAEPEVQPSQRIDPSIVGPLFGLADGEPELPRRNLRSGRALRLPSGQQVARAMGEPPLDEEALQLDGLPQGAREEIRKATPLWYYVLCEAAHAAEGRHLGPVGGRLVAEVLVGLLEGDPSSFLSQEPTWRPGELGTGEHFGMAELVAIARGGVVGGQNATAA
jgi:hypothetical protein